MPAKRNHLQSPALIVATLLLALAVTLFSFSRMASAEQAPSGEGGFVTGGFTSEPLPPGGDVSGVMGATMLPGPPEAEAEVEEEAGDLGPRDKRLRLTIPELGMKKLLIGSSPDQSFLDREGIMHLAGTDFPWEEGSEEGSNTYIAGHAIGYPGGRVPEAFRNLSNLEKGDRITLRDARGDTHRYRVYDRLIVDPNDFWVTEPVPGKDIVSLQTCYPEPTFEKRLIVRAERMSERDEQQ